MQAASRFDTKRGKSGSAMRRGRAGQNKFTALFLGHAGKAVDKWEQYLRVYDHELSALVAAGRPLRFLEIGVQNGGSLELWSKFLPEGSEIRGIDIDPRVSSLKFRSKHIRVDVVDATNTGRLQEILGGEIFDIIVDDGSHVCDDVRRSFELLFPRLELGGRYVIEDLACSYDPHYGGGFKSAGASIEFLKHLVDCLNGDHLQPDALDAEAMKQVSAFNHLLARITFYDSIAIIEKLSFEKKRPYQRILGGKSTALQPFANWLPFHPTSKLQGLLFAHPAARQFEPAFFTELNQRREQVTALSSKVAELSAEVERLRASLNDRRFENDGRT
jgi:SAM-dependent methyltransferase